MKALKWVLIALAVARLATTITTCAGEGDKDQATMGESLITGEFRWEVTQPVLTINPKKLPPSPDNPWHAVKDPSIVRYQGQWRLFCTLRKRKGQNGLPPGYVRIGCMSFTDWKDAYESQWHLLELSMDYHGAPQVFYFTPQKKWFLVYQLGDRYKNMPYGPHYSSTDDITDPTSWTAPKPFYSQKPSNIEGFFGLDYWVICDDEKAHLFFTTCNGRMWRAETRLQDFPKGFGMPEVALRADVFEASHTYRLKGSNKYLTLIEAQGRSEGRIFRYYKAYISDTLDGKWKTLAASVEKPFAGEENVQAIGPRWAYNFGHGELLRTGYNERLEVDPKNLQFLFQGANRDLRNPAFQLGLLEPARKRPR